MNVDHLLSSILRDISAASGKSQNRSAQEVLANRGQSSSFLNKLVQEEIRQKNQSEQDVPRPSRPTPPSQPDQPASPARPGQIRQIYTSRGQISQMSSFPMGKRLDSARLLKQMEASNANNNPDHTMTPGPKANEEVIASAIQQNFQLIKDSLKREKEKKRRKNRFKLSINCAAEEKALELLEILLEHADDADDMEAYCKWARERINQAEAQVVARRKEVPEQTVQSFKILRDAILALENGLSPDYIFNRLKDEIRRKKKLLDDLDNTSDYHEPSL